MKMVLPERVKTKKAETANLSKSNRKRRQQFDGDPMTLVKPYENYKEEGDSQNGRA